MRRKSVPAIILGVTLALLLIFLVGSITTKEVFESNILTLLSSDKYELERKKAISGFLDSISSRVVFLIGADSPDDAGKAAGFLYEQLNKTDLFTEVTLYIDKAVQREMFSQYYPFRAGLLTWAQQRKLEQRDYSNLWKETLRKLTGPATASFSNQLPLDPLLLYSDFVRQQVNTSGDIENDMLMLEHQGHYYALINAEINFSPYSIKKQKKFKAEISRSLSRLSSLNSELRIVRTGVVFYAISGSERALHDISTIGVGSVVGILILIIVSFRSVKPVVLSVVTIAIGILVGMSSCVLIFGKVHLLTLVFGSSLIGVSIDYAFHYFADIRMSEDGDPVKTISSILPGILLGVITSVIGYLMLLMTDFSGLREISVFSAAGLIASWFSVVFLFPYFRLRRYESFTTPVDRFSERFIAIWDQQWFRVVITTLLLFAVPIVLWTIKGVVFNDDIHILQSVSPFQQQQQKAVNEILNVPNDNRYLLVQADRPQALLEQEEEVTAVLQKLIESGGLTAYRATSKLFPSFKKQVQSRELLVTALEKGNVLPRELDAIGLRENQINRYRQLLKKKSPLLDVENIDNFEVPPLDSELWLGKVSDHYYSVILLKGLKNTNSVQELVNKENNISLIDQARDISRLFKEYRSRSIKLIAFAYLIIFTILMVRYRLFKSLLIIFPPVFASFSAIALAVWINEEINIFHIFAIILVLAIGIDYTLFFAERTTHRSTTMLAITLSAITTILSFGLLGLSDTKAISSFGITLMCGIFISFVLSPVVGMKSFPKSAEWS